MAADPDYSSEVESFMKTDDVCESCGSHGRKAQDRDPTDQKLSSTQRQPTVARPSATRCSTRTEKIMCTYCDKRMLKTQLKKHMGFCTNYLLRRYIDDANAERRDMKETIKQYTDELVEQRRLLVNQGKEIKELRSQVANLKDENSELHRGIGEMSTQAIATHILSNLLKQMGIEYDSSRSQTPTFGKDDYTDASNEKK